MTGTDQAMASSQPVTRRSPSPSLVVVMRLSPLSGLVLASADVDVVLAVMAVVAEVEDRVVG
jgi:hypothetical protein